MENEEKNDKKKRIENITTINFSITKCPLKVYQEFIAFSKEECNDNYSMGLKLLLDGMKGNIKEATLFQQYMELKERITKLELQLQKPKNDEPEVKKPKFKTLGSGGL